MDGASIFPKHAVRESCQSIEPSTAFHVVYDTRMKCHYSDSKLDISGGGELVMCTCKSRSKIISLRVVNDGGTRDRFAVLESICMACVAARAIVSCAQFFLID